jgi:hypothetical protein
MASNIPQGSQKANRNYLIRFYDMKISRYPLGIIYLYTSETGLPTKTN